MRKVAPTLEAKTVVRSLQWALPVLVSVLRNCANLWIMIIGLNILPVYMLLVGLVLIKIAGCIRFLVATLLLTVIAVLLLMVVLT